MKIQFVLSIEFAFQGCYHSRFWFFSVIQWRIESRLLCKRGYKIRKRKIFNLEAYWVLIGWDFNFRSFDNYYEPYFLPSLSKIFFPSIVKFFLKKWLFCLFVEVLSFTNSKNWKLICVISSFQWNFEVKKTILLIKICSKKPKNFLEHE